MYEEFYGLHADPFRLSSDHHFCFSHRSYARAKAYVQYALYRAEGFVMVTGRPGTGKTTLINDLLASLPDKEVVAGTLVSTQLEADDLLLMTGHAFGLDFPSQQKALVLQRLMEFFKQQHRQGLRTLLIIDEAQDLAPSALEELRLLTNLQLDGEPLLQIALLGQESLRGLVRSRAMEQVHQRLIAAWQLDPLEPEETIGYVRHRLERAGWRGNPSFEPGILPIVQEFSQGVPRRINLICSRLLLHGYIGELHTLTAEDGRTVARDLQREELALPDYDPDGASGGTGGAHWSNGDAAGQESGNNVWSKIDQGLFWTAPTKGPEPATSPAEARAPVQPVRPVTPEAMEEPSAPEEPRTGPATPPDTMTYAAASAPDPASEPLERVGTTAAQSTVTTSDRAVRADPRSSEINDSAAHIVADKDEDWPHAVGNLAPEPAQRPARRRKSRVLPWFILVVVSSVALTAVLFLSRTTGEDAPLADLSPVMASLHQWWDDSSAAAADVLQSLRREDGDDRAGVEPSPVTATDPGIATLPTTEPAGGAVSGSDGRSAAPTGLAPAEGPAPDGDGFAMSAPPATLPADRVPTTDSGSMSGAEPGTGAPSTTLPPDPTHAGAAEPAEPTSGTAGEVPTTPSVPEIPAESTSSAPAAVENTASARRPPPADRLANMAEVQSSPAAPDTNADAAISTPAAPATPPPVAAEAPLSGQVFFRVNSITVDPEFDVLLRELAEALGESEETQAEIIGYTDTTGPAEYNLFLSNQRATAVANRLMEHGVARDRLRIEGQGPREPAVGPEGYRAEDRVVEITIRHPSP